MLKVIYIVIAIFAYVGCASTSYFSAQTPDDGRAVQTGTFILEDQDEDSTAHGAAYVVDAMSIRTPMPSRPNWKPMEFYYKHCAGVGPKAYYSKTSYECSGPY